MSPKELKVLRLLMDNPKGLYGSELVELSNGYLSRGTIYTLLDRCVEKGVVKEKNEPPTQELKLSRTRHFITSEGYRAVNDYAEEMGFLIAKSSAYGG